MTNALASCSRVTEIEAYQSSSGTTTYAYDAAGNVTNDGVHTYRYDAENRLVSVEGGVTAQYWYDHQNRRVKKVSGGYITLYVWEGSHVIAEHDGTVNPSQPPGSTPYGVMSAQVDYLYVGSRLQMSKHYTPNCVYQYGYPTICRPTWTDRYYVSDIWSTRLVMDASGNVIGRMGHLPFGEEFAESGTQEKHHFTSYESEGESGTDYAMNRQYSPSVGRFQQADPYQASDYQVNPQSWNRYTYVENDPIHNVDQSGLFSGVPGTVVPDPCTGGGGEPPPPPKPTCTVFVKIKKIEGVGGVFFYHAFLLTQDNQTGLIQYAGARSSKADSAGLGGVLVGRFGDFNKKNAFGDFTAKVVASFGWTIKGTNCDPINNSFKASTDRINAAAYPYDPSDTLFGHNSNAFAYSLLVDYSAFTFFALIAEVSAWNLATDVSQPAEALPGWLDSI